MILRQKHAWKCRQLLKWRQAAHWERELVGAQCDMRSRQPQRHLINLSQ